MLTKENSAHPERKNSPDQLAEVKQEESGSGDHQDIDSKSEDSKSRNRQTGEAGTEETGEAGENIE